MLNGYSITSFVVKAREAMVNPFLGFGKLGQHGLDYGLNTQITIENAAQQNGINCQLLKFTNCRMLRKRKCFQRHMHTHCCYLCL